jgi:hypothetical protein
MHVKSMIKISLSLGPRYSDCFFLKSPLPSIRSFLRICDPQEDDDYCSRSSHIPYRGIPIVLLSFCKRNNESDLSALRAPVRVSKES